MHEACGGLGTELREFNGETDHLHMLVHYPPSLALSLFVDRLKGVSSRKLRQEYPSHDRQYLWSCYFWSPPYFAGSCGGARLSIVEDHIEQQKRPG